MRERTQNRRIDQSLTDLVNTIATDLGNDHSTPHTSEGPHDNHVDLANSLVQEGRPNTEKCTGHERLGGLNLPRTTVGRKPRERLLKMNVWFTQDDARLVQKISAARGQNAADFIQAATLKLLAELGAVGEERKRLLITLRG